MSDGSVPRLVTVALVDDHDMFRAAIRRFLDRTGDLRVVCEAADAQAAFAAIDAAQPDIVLLDLVLVGMDGLSIARELATRAPSARVVILTGHDSPDRVQDALEAGACAFLRKTESLDALIACLRQVARGERPLGPAARPRPGTGPLRMLSPREREVFGLLVRGFSNPMIAREFHLSPKTIETHREHILKKLGLHSVVGLVRYAARHRLLDEVARPPEILR
jgi:two-component system response regulator NreC